MSLRHLLVALAAGVVCWLALWAMYHFATGGF